MEKNLKKVLIFSITYYPRLIGGDVVAVKEITDRLDQKEFEFHLITLRFDKKLPKEEKIGNVFVYRLGFSGELKETSDSFKFPLHYNKYLFPFISAYKGWRLSQKNNFVFSWSIMANYAGFGALFFKLLKPKIPFLLTLQEGDPIEYIKGRVGLLYPLFKMIFTKADQIQAISYYLASFGKHMGFKGEPIVIANGVDVKNFVYEILQEERNSLRLELNLKPEDIALVTSSRLAIKNGVGDVIKALPLLPQNIKFVIIGEGYMKEELEMLAENLKVRDRVMFKGFLPHSNLPKYLKACDIFIRPSLSEGLGNSFIEAMAAELPTIGTPVGGIVDFLHDNDTGYLCQPENPKSIAETIERVISDPNKQTVIETGKNLVIRDYDWNKISVQMKAVFDSMS